MDCSPPSSSVHGVSQTRKYWSELLFASPGDLPNPEIDLASLHWQADSLPLSHQGSPVDTTVWTMNAGCLSDAVLGRPHADGVGGWCLSLPELDAPKELPKSTDSAIRIPLEGQKSRNGFSFHR